MQSPLSSKEGSDDVVLPSVRVAETAEVRGSLNPRTHTRAFKPRSLKHPHLQTIEGAQQGSPLASKANAAEELPLVLYP